MTCEWYRNAVAEGEQRGREEGREQLRQNLLNTARKILPPEASAALASITDNSALETAIWEKYDALAH